MNIQTPASAQAARERDQAEHDRASELRARLQQYQAHRRSVEQSYWRAVGMKEALNALNSGIEFAELRRGVDARLKDAFDALREMRE
jgi:hypothetical protein